MVNSSILMLRQNKFLSHWPLEEIRKAKPKDFRLQYFRKGTIITSSRDSIRKLAFVKKVNYLTIIYNYLIWFDSRVPAIFIVKLWNGRKPPFLSLEQRQGRPGTPQNASLNQKMKFRKIQFLWMKNDLNQAIFLELIFILALVEGVYFSSNCEFMTN